MIRVEGTLPAEKAVQLTGKKLKEFGLSVQNHIFGVVSDGASVMKKFARLLGTEHQICHAHGLHLSVCDILYKQHSEEDEQDGYKKSKKVLKLCIRPCFRPFCKRASVYCLVNLFFLDSFIRMLI